MVLNKTVLPAICVTLLFACYKKPPASFNFSPQLYPLQAGNVWIYIDSFYDDAGQYFGYDTFRLKIAPSITWNGYSYSPITDIYNDSIFIVRADDSSVYMLEPPGESLVFSIPVDTFQTAKILNYDNGLMQTVIYSKRLLTTNFPAYKVVITLDDGYWYDYEQKTMYFSPHLGVIQGTFAHKNKAGEIYTSDSYKLTAFTLN
jgi:hypothetical protein